MTSRLPSVIPAYIPGTNSAITFDDVALRDRDYAYTSNYGLIPMNIVVPSDISIPCLDNNECLTCSSVKGRTYTPAVGREDECNQCKCRIISFERLSNWYHKFKEYYNLLNHYGHCGTVYSSAIDYYYNEIGLINPQKVKDADLNGTKITLKGDGYDIVTFDAKSYLPTWKTPRSADISGETLVIKYDGGEKPISLSYLLPERNKQSVVLYYGNDKQTYIDLDEEIACMGGIVSSNTRNQTECQTSGIIESVDIGFYNWICQNVIPTYNIPLDLQGYWGRDTLYYPDVIKWIGWFDDRSQFASYTTEESCSASSDCCECVEYVKRGGAAERDRMETWYNDVQNKIIPESGLTDVCYEPFFISPIELQNSIEDLGEFTIFCEEYQDKVDYRVADGYGATANTKSGTTVIKDGELMRLKDGKLGYTFDDIYMESKFDEDAWEDEEYSYTLSGVSGYTTSKLKPLHRTNYLTDDIGNSIEGIYTFFSGDTNVQPPEGTVLEPIYQPRTIANIVRIGDTNQFMGDEILSMEFYYKDYDDVILDSTRFSAETPTSSNTETALDAIESATSAVTSSANTKLYQDDIFCNIEYEVGRIYEMSSSGSLESVSSGVSYTEEVQFVKERTEYYLKKKDNKAVPSDVEKPDVHSVSYPIYVYRLKQESEDIDDNAYNSPYYDNLAEFKALIERKYDPDYEVSGDTKSPIIREEYRLGIAAPENVRGNIYIDRGINSAFEKHLKIGEVTSMESLLQYGNGYFKIMDN